MRVGHAHARCARWSATEAYSDNNGGVWPSVSNSEHSIFTMHYAMLYSTW
jgi:hypothetical protein